MFEPISYLEWIAGRPEGATFDLGSSDLRGSRELEWPIPASLEERPDPHETDSLEALVAENYGGAIGPDDVLLTAGATQANVLAVWTLAADHAATKPTVLV